MLKDQQKKLVYILIFLVPFVILFSRTQSFNNLKFTLLKVVNIPIQIIAFPFNEAKKVLFYHRTFEEYKLKNKEVNEIKARLVGLEEVILENTRLEKLLEFKRKLIYSSVAANVVGRNPSRWSSAIVIDKGSDDGVKQGMPVVNSQGVVGKIADVSSNQSKVMLATDPQFSVAALIQRPRETGVVTGTLQGLCRVKFLLEDADIRVGDKVITSKLSGSYPESLLIGEVVKIIESRENQSTECLLEPAVSFSQLEEVLVILN